MSAADHHPPGRSPWLWVLACLGLLWYVPTPPRMLTPDAIAQLSFASCLDQALVGWMAARTPTACPGTDHWSPGLPVVLVVLSRVGVPALLALRMLPLLCAALLPFPLYTLGRALGGPSLGHAAGLWAAFLSVPLLQVRINAVMPDARLPALLATFSAWAMLARWGAGGRPSSLWSAGALAALAGALRPEGKLVFVLLAAAAAGTSFFRARASSQCAPEGSRLLPGLPRAGLRGAAGALCHLLGGFVVASLPLQGPIGWLGGRLSPEPRAWEISAASWVEYLPLWLFVPLFETGAQPTALRLRFQEALRDGQLELAAHERVSILFRAAGESIPPFLQALAETVSLELLVVAVLGGIWLWRAPDGRQRLLLWAILLAPLGPLSLLPQSVNPRQPEGNLLFVPVALLLPAGLALALGQRRLRSHTGAIARLAVPGVILVGLAWTLRQGVGYAQLLQQRGGTLFESSPEVQRTAVWLAQETRPGTQVRTSYAAQVIPLLAGRPRLPWPSAWEIPAWQRGRLQQEEAAAGLQALPPIAPTFAGGRRSPQVSAGSSPLAPTTGPMGQDLTRELILVTSIDLADNPLAVREWQGLEPPLRLLHHEVGPGGSWIAVLEPAR